MAILNIILHWLYQKQRISSASFSGWCSDGKRETTTGEPLLRASVLVDLPRFHLLLSFALHGFAALLLVVLPFHLLKLASQALNFVLVLVHLSLVHVQLSSHGLHLVRLLLQVLLVDRKLLSDLRARLSSQKVLQLNVELLLLLNGHVLLDYLLSFLDQALLESLDLKQKLEGIWVSALKLPPSMVVQGVLKLLREGLDLKTLLLEGVTETKDFLLVLGDL